MDEDMKEYGLTILKGVGESKVIWMFSIIGEIEGHESAQQQTKTTQYEHVLPLLTKAENQEEVEGILFLINTVGGDDIVRTCHGRFYCFFVKADHCFGHRRQSFDRTIRFR